MRNRLTERDLSRIVNRVVKENKNEVREIGRILDDIMSSFEFSEKGNDEMITLANYILENPEGVANMIMGKLKRGYGAHDEDESGFGTYTSRIDDFKRLESRLNSRR
jgi:hypothetical protein